ncbi:gamma-mobile-trio protein GmtX [Pseudoalteromonas sp. M58]|uniref:gamma-mobile-trio protein GmtX n=1 Tax=Pseudoalteromonas sp. M58 TaxID=3141534 RepID=UPI003671A1A1
MSKNVEVIFNELLNRAKSKRVKNNLEILKLACDSQIKNKSNDFSIATIGRISDSLGGIKAQSIRNKTGRLYQQLIIAYNAENPTDVIDKKLTEPMSWVGRIEDPELRYKILDLIASEKKLKNELNQLKAITEIEVDLRSERGKSPMRIENSLSDVELKALSDFISDNKLADNGFKIGSNGRLVNSMGKPITKPGFIDAIQKLLTID